MKIKTKKQLNLPQLIEWGFNNPELAKGRLYNIDDEEARFAPYVSFPTDGTGVRVPCTITHDDTFTVEVEEEITEDTRLDKLVVRYRNDDIYIFPQERIDDFKNDSSIVAFYIPNDDCTMTLIWRDGKLVE